mgnify:CR=1 FL=1
MADVPHEHSLSEEIYSLRMLVFLEEEPQSNKYRQVILTPEQYNVVSVGISHNRRPIGGDMDEVEEHLSSEVYTLPDLQELPIDTSR